MAEYHMLTIFKDDISAFVVAYYTCLFFFNFRIVANRLWVLNRHMPEI